MTIGIVLGLVALGPIAAYSYDLPAHLADSEQPEGDAEPGVSRSDAIARDFDDAAGLSAGAQFFAPQTAGRSVDHAATLYRGPQPGQATGPLNPADFPGRAGQVPNGRSYWTSDRSLADSWAKQYGTETIQVSIPRPQYDSMTELLRRVPEAGEVPYLGGLPGQTEMLIPRWLTPWLNKFPMGPAQ